MVLGLVVGAFCVCGASTALAVPLTNPAFTLVGPPTATGHRPLSVAISPNSGLLATSNASSNTVSMFSVTAGGALTSVGSDTPTGNGPNSVAFSPNGDLLATANKSAGTVSMFSVTADGALTPVGSDTPTGSSPYSLAISPNGGLLATANSGDATVSVFSVSAGGTLTPVGSPTGTATDPRSVAFSPDGGLLATADTDGNAVSVFSVSAGGALTPVGSPVSTGPGTNPTTVAFSPDGGLLATANLDTGTVSIFSVSAAGVLTQEGTPMSAGAASYALAFSPNGQLLATTSLNRNTVSVFAGGDPTAQITSPAAQQAYAPNQQVATSFACTAPGGSGAITSCTDSNNASSPSGTLDTSALGAHTYTVTATSSDGLTTTARITYTVLAPPLTTATTTTTTTPVAVWPVTLGPVPSAGVRVSDNGTVILSLVCPQTSSGCDASGVLTIHLPNTLDAHDARAFAADTVLASFSATMIASGRSAPVDVSLRRPVFGRLQSLYIRRVKATLTLSNHLAGGPTVNSTETLYLLIPPLTAARCADPTGHLSAATLGAVTLGATRARAHQLLPRFTVRSYHTDNFCLSGGPGVRVGYASARLLGTSPTVKQTFTGAVVLALTANRFYTLRGARAGARLATAAHQLKLGEPIRSGANDWYVVPGPTNNGVLKVRDGVIQEVGIVNKRLTTGRAAQLRLLRNF